MQMLFRTLPGIALMLGPLLFFRCFSMLAPLQCSPAIDSVVFDVLSEIETATQQQKLAWFFDSQICELSSFQDERVSNEARGTCVLRMLQFDPSAVVVILPGADAQPGVAGVDDNGNGGTDDHFELGATKSDDCCQVIKVEVARSMNPRPLVLQRGAFVHVKSKDDLISGAQQRLQVVINAVSDPDVSDETHNFSFMITDSPLFP